MHLKLCFVYLLSSQAKKNLFQNAQSALHTLTAELHRKLTNVYHLRIVNQGNRVKKDRTDSKSGTVDTIHDS